MRLGLVLASAGFAALTLTGCEQPPPGSAPQLDTPQFEPLELDLPDADAGANPDQYGPLLPADPGGPGEAPEPNTPGEVTAYCHGGDIVDYKPKTPEAHARAQGICTDQQTYDQHGFPEPDPRSGDTSGQPSGDPFANPDQFQQDMQQQLNEHTNAN